MTYWWMWFLVGMSHGFIFTRGLIGYVLQPLPDPLRADGFRVVGWGPFPMPGEDRRLAEARAQAIAAIADAKRISAEDRRTLEDRHRLEELLEQLEHKALVHQECRICEKYL